MKLWHVAHLTRIIKLSLLWFKSRQYYYVRSLLCICNSRHFRCKHARPNIRQYCFTTPSINKTGIIASQAHTMMTLLQVYYSR